MSPYRSRAQQKKFHKLLEQGRIDAATVKEFDDATDFSSLPDKVRSKRKPKKRRPK